MPQIFSRSMRIVSWVILLLGVILAATGYGQGSVDDGRRYLMFTVFHYDDIDGRTQQRQIESMELAFAGGCNSVVIGIAWDVLQPTLTSAPNWAYIDRFVQVAQRHNAKIALRLRTARRDRTGFWPDEQSMRDVRGNIMNVEGISHCRFGYTPAMDKIQEFVRSVAQRYKYLNDRGDLLFMSVTFNPQWENEYWFMNYPEQYVTSYDFNELTIGDFQRWVLVRYNGSLDAINRSWNTNYQSTADIRPTYPDSKLSAGYLGKHGEDWYVFRHLQLKAFNDRFARTVKSVDPRIRLISEQGSIYDIISANRGTLGFKNLAESFDGVKSNDGLEYTHQFTMDLMRSNVRPGAWIINEMDGANYLIDRVDRSSEQAAMAETCFAYGAKIMTLANFWIDANGEYLRAILEKIKAKRLLDQPVATVSPVGTMTYKLSTVVQSNVYESGIVAQWNTMRGGNEQKPVQLILDEDILKGVPPLPEN